MESRHFNPDEIDKGKGKIYDKKLIICSKDLFVDKKELDKAYPHPYEIVDKEVYYKVIQERQDVNVLWSFLAGDGNYFYLVNPSTWHIKLIDGTGPDQTEKAQKKAQIRFLEKMCD
ncbi:MAG: hypothetical protein NTU44_14855 [Bacteroidetes bacterium]|nr:hypothetical protein [Bacteroidota bacterium]